MPPEILEAFRSARLRLGEARRQRHAFESVWSEYRETNPWSFALENLAPMQYRVVAKELTPIPGQLSLHFGMWLQQQRAALDNALYALMGVREGTFPPSGEKKLEFPITRDLGDFNGRPAKKARAFDDQVANYLESVQPYHYPNISAEYTDAPEIRGLEFSPLHWLNELARIDRHRVMHVGVASIRIPPHVLLHGGADHEPTYFAPEGQLLTGTTRILEFTTTEPLRSEKMRLHVDTRIVPEVAEWAQTKSLEYVYLGVNGPSDARWEWQEVPRPLLLDRMADVEFEVRYICRDLADLAAGRSPERRTPFLRQRYLRRDDPDKWRAEAVRRKRDNGG